MPNRRSTQVQVSSIKACNERGLNSLPGRDSFLRKLCCKPLMNDSIRYFWDKVDEFREHLKQLTTNVEDIHQHLSSTAQQVASSPQSRFS